MKKILFAIALFVSVSTWAQDNLTNKEGSNYKFEVINSLDATAVQNQSVSATCWSFSALSFFESELIRMDKEAINLSEMYIVRQAYLDKADRYVRMHGHFNFGPGGAFHDIPYVIRKHGIIPESAYKGLNYGLDYHRHLEMDAILKGMVDAVIENPNKKLSPAWKDAIAGATDAYLGTPPEKFEYKGEEYTPKSFKEKLGLNMDDYVSLTSFTHHPFYKEFILEIPDNWVMCSSYNLPLDEFMSVMENAIDEGYTFAWASDVSEKGFSFRDGLAIVPEDMSTIKTIGKDSEYYNDAGAEKQSNAFNIPVKELNVTQELRQEAFDNYETTDDHGMHITGMVKDQDDTKYFIVKNSWGDKNECDGYFYASEAYVRYKTLNIYLHKDALPKKIKDKLGIE